MIGTLPASLGGVRNRTDYRLDTERQRHHNHILPATVGSYGLRKPIGRRGRLSSSLSGLAAAEPAAAVKFMPDQIIPLTAAPNQNFSVPVNIDGATVTLRLAIRFSEMSQYWTMDVADQSGNPMISNAPLITGEFPAANVLAQYGYLKIGSAYVLNASNAQQDYPGISNLGTDFVLLWSDTAP